MTVELLDRLIRYRLQFVALVIFDAPKEHQHPGAYILVGYGLGEGGTQYVMGLN